MATFNSRYLNCKQISEQFIPTQNFYQLARPCHSVLLGARGSGKTTMFKMLQPEAVKEYAAKDSSFDVPFYGVYIPSDRQWSFILEQLESYDIPFLNNVSKALVNLNVLLSFLETLNYVLKSNDTTAADNYNFSKSLIRFLKLGDNVPPMLELIRLELRTISIDLHIAVQEKKFDFEIPYICKTPFIDSLSQIIEMIDVYYCNYGLKDHWALCFDEMEIAPEWLQRDIISRDLRSRYQRLYFKITSTPDWEIKSKSIKDPSVNNDIELIKCWNGENSNIADWRNFCDNAIQTTILQKYDIDKEKLKDYVTLPNKDRQFFLENLPKVDKGFAQYFRRDSDRDEKDRVIISRASQRSKYYNGLVLAMRYYHYCTLTNMPTTDNNTYLGDWLLYSMADGNPRSLFNILNEIPINMDVNGKLKMNIPALGRVVREYSAKALDERFSYCAMVPLKYGGNVYNFRDIIIKIGTFFKDELLGIEYNPFPRTMFAIDDTPQFHEFVHTGLEAGAIVRIEDKKVYADRFNLGVYRLSYMLYPYFGYVYTPTKEVVLLSEIFKDINNETK